MSGTPPPRLAKSYPAHVVLVVLTLFPGLINTSAVSLLAPVIGHDLGKPADAAATIPLISDAALAFGCVLAAELTRRIDNRILYFWLLGVSLLSSLLSALAPSFGVLLAAHIVHGLAAGMLFIVVLPPLIVNFGSDKLPTTAMVLVPALYGAVTFGPLLGGLVAAPFLWRSIFAAEVIVAIVALALAPAIIESREPQGGDQPVDWFALIAAATGSVLIYAGIGALAGNSLADPWATAPFAAGILAYVALIIGEARMRHPLIPVRKLVTSLALVGTIATVIGSAAFSALTQSFSLTLLRVDGLSARATGLAFWPELLTAIASGYLFGRVVTTKYVVLTGAAGLGLLALAAALARAVAPVDAASVMWLCAIGGMGAGLSVSPGLFIVTLSFERALVARAIALLNLFRLTGGFVSAPGVEHTIGSRAMGYLHATGQHAADAALRAYIIGRPIPNVGSAETLKRVLVLGINDAYVIVASLAAAGVVAIAALLLAARVRLVAPDLQRFERGQPALIAPQLP